MIGEWTVIGVPSGRSVLCRCSCGTVKLVNIADLESGRSRRCRGHLYRIRMQQHLADPEHVPAPRAQTRKQKEEDGAY